MISRAAARKWVAAALATAAWAFASAAYANTSARLVYIRGAGAEACPEEEGVRTAVAARLGYDPFFPWATTTVVVELAREHERFRADVKLIGENGIERGSRHLETKGSVCADLVSALALTISIVVDPLSLTSPVPEARPSPMPAVVPVAESAPPPAPLPEPPPPPQPVAAKPASPSAPIRGFVGAGVLGSVGSAPAPTFGADLFGGIARRALSLELGVRGDLPASTAAGPGNVRSEAALASLRPCVRLGVPFFCAVGSMEAVSASAFNVAQPRTGLALAGGVGARAGAEISLGRGIAVRAYADAVWMFARPSLLLDGSSVYSFSALAVDVGLAGVFRFNDK